MGGADKLYSYRYNTFNEYVNTSIAKKNSFYKTPAIAYMKPFKITGNLYYIGDKMVCSYLIDTGEGLIMFDSGYQHTIHLLIQSIWELGFNPSKIKYLIHTHGHFDHFGACNEFRALYGCKTFMNKADVDMIKDKPVGALMSMSPNPCAELPTIDEAFDDGDIIELGDTRVNCVNTPGHTPGNTTFFFNVAGNKKQDYKVGYLGGTGFMTLHRTFLEEYGFPLSLRDDFITSIKKIENESVDIVLTGHPTHNKLLEKYGILMEDKKSNPFIDEKEWKTLLNKLLQNYKLFLDTK